MIKLNKKLKKLKNKPFQFFKDALINISAKKRHGINISHKVINKYEVVSAVYNSGKYLDDYFSSLVRQSIGFKKNIRLILVDDGSVDNSSEIIERWRKKYPKNIFYFYKSNGGQASARNVGLENCIGEWVSFIDPDDFVDVDYFLNIDKKFLKVRTDDVVYVASKIILFQESDGKYYDTHPLSSKFSKFHEINDVRSNANLQLSAASAVFNLKLIKASEVSFPLDVKPTFEDAFFLNVLCLKNINKKIILSKNSHYYYRRRIEENSTVDRSWERSERYDDIFKNGYLKLLELSRQSGVAEKFIQRVVLYDMAWYVKRFVYHPKKINSVDNFLREKLISHMHDVFSSIEEDTIMKFEYCKFWMFYKLGTVFYFKKKNNLLSDIFVKEIDNNSLLEFSYFFTDDVFEYFTLNNEEVFPVFSKVREHKLFEGNFIKEKILHFSVEKNDKFMANLGGANKRFCVPSNNNYPRFLDISKVPNISSVEPFKNWILMDRDVKANDNAEHFYRYLKNNHPELNIYFAINRESVDWTRLFEDGFNLVDYSSDQFSKIFEKCQVFASSHNAPALLKKIGYEKINNKKFIFLQHGVIKANLSSAYNYSKIDFFVTSGTSEFLSIVNESEYKFSKKNVFLTGMPRHDELVKKSKYAEAKHIIVMPTWRQNAVGEFTGDGLRRVYNPVFFETEYFKRWNQLINHRKLKNLAENLGLEIVFLPHPEIMPYVSGFNFHSDIKVLDVESIDIQKYFAEAKFLITDYSSVDSDFAIMRKPVFYFQFDKEEFFNGHSKLGYFDYEEDGFGPISTSVNELIKNIKNLILKDGALGKYIDRMSHEMKFVDGKCSERIYKSFIDINFNNKLKNSHVENIASHVLQSINNRRWTIAENRVSILEKEISKNHMRNYEEIALEMKNLISSRKFDI